MFTSVILQGSLAPQVMAIILLVAFTSQYKTCLIGSSNITPDHRFHTYGFLTLSQPASISKDFHY